MNEDISNNQNPEEPQREQQPEAPQEPVQQTPPPPPPPSAPFQQAQPQYAPPQYGAYPPPPRPANGRNWIIPVALGIGCLPWALLFFLFLGAIISGIGGGVGKGDVALIHITGAITGGESKGGILSGATVGSEDVIQDMEKIRKKSGIKAVVLRINSPGGSAAGSEEIYNEIIRLRKSGKIVYASMGDMAASGGYYIASACDKIYADANTLTGSIGVIFSLADMSDLYKKIGYKAETIKAGKYKDIGSPNRPLTAEERAMLQGLVNDTYTNFMTAVANGRKMPLSKVKQLAEGRIYSGNSALKAGLIDKIGGLRETEAAVAKQAGIKGQAEVVEYGGGGLFGSFSGSDSDSSAENLKDAMRREFLKKLVE